jgi:hypothetical protein
MVCSTCTAGIINEVNGIILQRADTCSEVHHSHRASQITHEHYVQEYFTTEFEASFERFM